MKGGIPKIWGETLLLLLLYIYIYIILLGIDVGFVEFWGGGCTGASLLG
jgi:hypothetical protein